MPPWTAGTRFGRIDGASDDVFGLPELPETRGINDEKVAAIGARPQPLSDILVEVAAGCSVLVHAG